MGLLVVPNPDDSDAYIQDQKDRSATNLCVGEVVDLCLDGDVVVRLGASPGCTEIKATRDRIVVIKSGDSGVMDDGLDWEDDETASESGSESEESLTDGNCSDDSEESSNNDQPDVWGSLTWSVAFGACFAFQPFCKYKVLCQWAWERSLILLELRFLIIVRYC